MKLWTSLSDLLYRKQKILEIIVIFLFFALVTFKFDSKNLSLLWSDCPSVAIILAIITAIFAIIWLKIQKQKIQLLIDDLKKGVSENKTNIENKIVELSSRQRKVFDLIISGKSNKEIIAELNIELSTLKTHINQVYKILGIKNRKELKMFDKQTITIK